MKLIIAGSRDMWIRVDELDDIICNLRLEHNITEVVWGGAEGIDECGREWADFFGIPVIPFPAEWDKYGDPAGPIRNKKMADYADMLLLILDGKSRGSNNMKKNMKKLGKPIREIIREKRI